MRTISILNLKGGVGKTVTAVTLAAMLAEEHGKRVLLIDCDSQANASEFYGADPVSGCLSTVLRIPHPDATIVHLQTSHTAINNLDVLPADDGLMDLDLSAIQDASVNPAALREAVISLYEHDDYDYIIIDCPPAFNAASTAALIASDEVIIPIKLDAFSLRGLANIMAQIKNMRKVNRNLRVAGILPTMFYGSQSAVDALRVLRESGLPVYNRQIRRSTKIDDMTYAQESISSFSPHSAAAIDYRKWVREFVKEEK